METTANKALVGFFTLVVLAAGFVFIYWVAKTGVDEDARPITVMFSDPVPGLSKGSPVTFNGVRVGEVTAIDLNPEDPRQVLVRLAVDGQTPVKKDTQAFLSQPSLTGLVVVDLSGGSPDVDSVWYGESNPVLSAEPSGLSDLISNARRTLAKVEGALGRVETLIDVNADKIDRAVSNVEEFTEALSQNSEGIGTVLASVSRAADAIARVSDPLERIVERGDSIAEAIDPEQVRQIVTSLNTFSSQLSDNSDDIDRLVTTLSTISTDVSGFTGRLAAIGDRTETLLTDVGGKAGRLLDALEPAKVGETLDNLNQITAAIEPEQVRTAVTGFSDLSATLSARRGEIDTLVTQLSAAAADVSVFTTTLPDAGARISSLLAAVDPDKLGSTIDNLDQITSAIEPEQVRTAVAGFSDLSATLSARRDDIEALVTQLSATARDISAFTQSMPDAGARISEVLAAVDPVKVGESLDGVHQFTTALGGRSADIDEIMNSARAVAARFDSISARADSLLAKLDAMTGSGGGNDIIAEARATLKSVRLAAESFSRQSESIGGGVNDFTNRGLRDLQAFIRQGQRTVNRLDRVISDLERNPGQFLLGGEQRVPNYSIGNRR